MECTSDCMAVFPLLVQLLLLIFWGDDDDDDVVDKLVIAIALLPESTVVAAEVAAAAAFSRDCDSNDPIMPTPPFPELGAEITPAASAEDGRNMDDDASDNARGR